MERIVIDDGTKRHMVVLSRREQDVTRCVSHGLPNKEIAFRLKIAMSTTMRYVADLLRELGFSNRVELARWAFFYPQIFNGSAVDVALHLPGCTCPHPRCVIMISIDRARAES